METRNELEIKRLAPGESVRVAGKFGGYIYRRENWERKIIRGKRQAAYVIRCTEHPGVRARYSDTLKMAVSMAGDTSTWCNSCAVEWADADTVTE
jgi:hypothetical protein